MPDQNASINWLTICSWLSPDGQGRILGLGALHMDLLDKKVPAASAKAKK
jgi:hypothetical protein